MNGKVKGTALVLAAAFLWGIMGVFIRNLHSAGLSNFDITFCRCVLSGAGYFIITYLKNKSALKVDLKGLIICFLFGMTVYGISFLSYNVAVQHIPMGIATVLIFMSPIWVSLLGRFVFKDKLDKYKYTMIAICVVGAILAANLIGSIGGSIDFIGIFAALFNGIGMALQIMVPRYFEEKYDCDTMIMYGFIGSAIMLSFGADFGNIYTQALGSGNISVLIDILIVRLACTMLANSWYTKAPKYIGSVSTSMLAAMEVVGGILAGYIIFNEILLLSQWIGIVIIISSVIAFRWERKNKSVLEIQDIPQ